MATPTVVVTPVPALWIRALWFLFVGWYLGAIVSAIAWLLNLTIIGLPLGAWLINRLPVIITLRGLNQNWRIQDGMLVQQVIQQRPLWLRALYFIFIGWWFSGIWMALAYIATLSLIGIPIGFWMYGRIGAITTLYRI